MGGGGAAAGAGTATVRGGVGSHVDDVDEGPLGKSVVTWMLAWKTSEEPFSMIGKRGCGTPVDELST